MKQISVFVENKVGSLGKVTHVLREAGINLRAVASFDSPAYGILRLIVDQPEKARDILHEKNFAVRLSSVLAVELRDHPGALDELFACLAAADISVNYIYSFVLREQAEPLMVLHVSDMEKAAQTLEAAGIHVTAD